MLCLSKSLTETFYPFSFHALGQRAISYAMKHLFNPTNTAAEDIQDMSSACCMVSRKPLDNLP